MKLRSGEIVTVNIAGCDRVELIEELGSGGDGHVWKVKPLAPGQAEFLVLKSIRLDPELNDEQCADHVRRIRREAGVRVDSAYIIRCLGLREVARDHFALLFPYEPGGNLEAWIRARRDRPLNEIKALFLKILDGVQALHQAQIIHRDLKPKNMLVVMPAETPRIFDFGLAKFRNRESVTEVGTIAGTDAYIAPEVFGWGGIKAVDERCDIYALGIILYEMIVGKNPWRANGWKFGDFAEYLRKQNRDGGDNAFTHILQIDGVFECLDEPARKAIEYATMFEPDRRFHSVAQLRQVVQGLSVSLPQPRLIDYVPHHGDTFLITQQALAHEQEAPPRARDLNAPETPVEAPRNPPEDAPTPNRRAGAANPSTSGGSSGCGWLIVVVIGVLGVLFGGMGVGAWGVYRWWRDRQPVQVTVTPTPTPRPTATPTLRPSPTPGPRRTAAPTPQPGADSGLADDLQKILGGDPSPTPSPTATPSPAPEPQHTVNPGVLENLLRRSE